MIVAFTERAWEDYVYWQQTDKAILKRLNALIKDVKRHPFEGIGQPEPLKHELSGSWSRRIDGGHRLVCELKDDEVIITQCRYHY